MMTHTHYCRPDDMRLVPELVDAAPAEAQAFLRFDEIAGRADGAIPQKYRELIAIAVALTTQCPYCLDRHTKKAREHQVTREEVAEAAFIVAALRGGAALAHGLLALRLFGDQK